MKVIYPAIFHSEDGGFWVEFPDLPGCSTQGDTEAETYANAVEAMELFYKTIIRSIPCLRRRPQIKLKRIKKVLCLLYAANLK